MHSTVRSVRHHVRADVLLLRHAVDAELLVEQVDPVVVGQLRPLRARCKSASGCDSAASPRASTTAAGSAGDIMLTSAGSGSVESTTSQSIDCSRPSSCRRRARCRSPSRSIRTTGDFEPDAVAALAHRVGHALEQQADALARIHVLREVGRRIRLDAEHAQDDVLQIQLGDALRLLRRDLRRSAAPTRAPSRCRSTGRTACARGCARPTLRTSLPSAAATTSSSASPSRSRRRCAPTAAG